MSGVGIVDDVRSSAEDAAAALTGSGYRADFSPGSLWELERFFDEQAPGGQPRPGGLLVESLGAKIFGVGAYLGEVIRRGCGGEWRGDDTDPDAEINVTLCLADQSLIWPIQRVMKRYRNGPEDNVAVYGHLLGLEVGPRPASA